MKYRVVMLSCIIVLLSGCASFGQSGILVTPIGVAGIHSFGPGKKSTPDNFADKEKAAQRIASRTRE